MKGQFPERTERGTTSTVPPIARACLAFATPFALFEMMAGVRQAFTPIFGKMPAAGGLLDEAEDARRPHAT